MLGASATDPEKEIFDLLVIGGGITGVGIARDAALRGLKTLLTEKGVLGGGTSSKSSKLVHGGLRYLEQGEFSLVRGALRERSILLRTAPDLVWPLPFVLPVFRGARRGRLAMRLGLTIYDLLSFPHGIRRHLSLSQSKIADFFPDLRTDGLHGGFLYFDAQTEDLALTRAVAASARTAGALVLERTQVQGFAKRDGRIEGVVALEQPSLKPLLLHARVVVNAAGPWVDAIGKLDDAHAKPKLRLTKGVHIVFDRQRLRAEAGLLLFAPQDGRVFFVLPWKGKTIVGTTDTDFLGAPDEVAVEPGDIVYLLEAVAHYFPKLTLVHADVKDSFAGLRPLLRQEEGSASQVSREHEIFASSSGLLTIAGGKLTSFRQMAQETVDRVVAELRKTQPGRAFGPCRTAEMPLQPES